MTTNSAYSAIDAAVAAQLSEARNEREIRAKLGLVEDYGLDLHPDGTKVAFTKTFAIEGRDLTRTYSYVAIKAGGSWYTTGPAGRRQSWDEFVLWLVSGPEPTRADSVMLLEATGRSLPQLFA
jgi:hypothetical protein